MSSGISPQQPRDTDLTYIAKVLQGTATGVLKKTATNTWALDANLFSIGAVGAPADSTFLVGNGSSWVGESGATARASLGLGNCATLNLGAIAGTVAEGDHSHSGNKEYHGIQSGFATPSFNDSTHVLSVGAVSMRIYWVRGEAVLSPLSTSCDLDSYVTLTANTLYRCYFSGTDDVLRASTSPFNLADHVPVATVFWNGTAGAVNYELHNHTRDTDWHAWAHQTIGARYGSGLSLNAPTTASDESLSIGSGLIYDEDIAFTISAQTVARAWYKVSASVYTFADISLPFTGATLDPQYLDTDTYTLTSAADSDYLNMWVYASTDVSRPIYIIPTHASAAFNTIAGARAEAAPNLSGLNMSPEMKLLYRLTYKGDGQFQESVDYRNSSSVPAGGTPSTSASAVSFVPSGNIAALTVQTALEELDSEKQPLNTYLTDIAALAVTDSNIIVGNGTTWVAETGATARTSLGLGNCATLNTGTAAGTVATGDHTHSAYAPVVAGSATVATLSYNGTTHLAGALYGGTTTPTGTTRLNYGGYFYPTFLNLVGSGDTATAATHYFVETGTDGYVRPKTLANVKTELVTAAAVNTVAVAAGSATASVLKYNGTTALAGAVDGGTTTPTGTARLNYGGYLYPTSLNLVGSADTATAATHYFVEVGTDGFVKPKTLANVKAELLGNQYIAFAGATVARTYTLPDATTTLVGLTDIQTLTNKTLANPKFTGGLTEDIYAITDGAAFEIDPANGTIQTIVLGANRTPKGTNWVNGQRVLLQVKDGTGYTITWTDSTFGASGVTWLTTSTSGTAPALDTSRWTVIELWRHGGNVYGNFIGYTG